jgi:citrate lyase beta subunit
VILGLEDAVPVSGKDKAWESVAAWFPPTGRYTSRVNAPSTEWFCGEESRLSQCHRKPL